MIKQALAITNEQIIEFLSKTDLFSNLSLDSLKEISEGFEVVYLDANTILIQQGEISNCLYVLMYGFLRARKKDAEGQEQTIGEIGAGSVVGEIGCLFDEPRTASVYSIRDSVLLKMTKNAFNALLLEHPAIMMGITKESVKRLVNPKKYSPKRDISCFTLVPAGNFTEIEQFSHMFVEKLATYGETLILTYETFNQTCGINATKAALESAEVLSFFQELESKYRFLVYVVTKKDEWATRCIRQADKILLIGQYGEDPSVGKIEQQLFTKKTQMSPAIELVLLAGDNVKHLVGVNEWIRQRELSNHYKVRLSRQDDLSRLVRLVTGNALGLILSGGGALSLAHVGTLRALHEENIVVDYIGGASMGSLVAGLHAMEVDIETMTEMLIQQLTKFQSSLDFTFPMIALIRAKNLDNLLSSSIGKNVKIEDLWQKFFCVSTNITTNSLEVHEKNLLWRSIRASIALPGILPAVFDEKKQILVDGGILNNLPVDIMASKLNDGKILSSSIKRRKSPATTIRYDEYTSSGWHLLFKYFLLPKLKGNGQNKRVKFMNIASIIQNSMIIGSNNYEQEMILRANYNILMDLKGFNMMNFVPIKKIINSGYRQAKKALETMDLSKHKN